MPCENCERLFSQLESALAAYKDAMGNISGLHAWDLKFNASHERKDKARQRFEAARSALLEHEQAHKDMASASGSGG